MIEILSQQNSKFKTWRLLLESRGVKKQGLALLSGRKLIEEFLSERPEQAEELLTARKLPFMNFDGAKTYQLSSDLFRELDVLGTDYPILVVRIDAIPDWQNEPPQGLELIVAFSDPGNLGAVLRSAEAFGVNKVILTEEASSPFLPKALRAASGATFRQRLVKTGALKELRAQNAFGLDMSGVNIHDFAWPENLCMIVGEEGRGLPESLELKRLSIPMRGASESLNAMAAASIALFAYRGRWP